MVWIRQFHNGAQATARKDLTVNQLHAVELQVEIVDAKEGLLEGLGHLGVQAFSPDDVSECILRQPGGRKV